jgi:hypothetical protein
VSGDRVGHWWLLSKPTRIEKWRRNARSIVDAPSSATLAQNRPAAPAGPRSAKAGVDLAGSAARTIAYVHAMMASAKSAQKFGATIKRRAPAPTMVAAILSVIIFDNPPWLRLRR